MKSGKQRREEILTARANKRRQRRAAKVAPSAWAMRPCGMTPVTPALLAPYNSYGSPPFVLRGYYEDLAFRCVDCGAEGVWTAERQRWWYEVAQGDVFTTARRCATCRARERARKEAARREHFAGLQRKAALRPG